MYDKLKLWSARTRATPDVSKYLDRAKDQIDHSTGEVCTFGCIDGLKVTIYTGGISIIGSLAKFLYPNNIYPLDRHTTAEAIEKLSDGLHMPVAEAKVSGLEFGTQYVMSHPVEEYLKRMGNVSKMRRDHYNDGTLYYKARGKQQPKVYAFYDKRAEASVKGMSLPVGFNDANLLKYEIRLNRRLPQQLKVAQVKASTLWDKSFYRMLVKLYQDTYFAIPKNKQLKTEYMDNIKTVTDGADAFFARLINQTDPEQITDFLNELKERNVYEDRKNYSRLKNRLQRVASKASITESDDLIKELDDDIRNVGAYV